MKIHRTLNLSLPCELQNNIFKNEEHLGFDERILIHIFSLQALEQGSDNYTKVVEKLLRQKTLPTYC